MYPDKIKITQITMDNELKVTVEASPIFSKASIEVENRELFGRDGTVVRSHTKVFIPDRRVMQDGVFKYMNLQKGDMIEYLKVSGRVPAAQDQVRHPVLMVSRVGHQRAQFIELLV